MVKAQEFRCIASDPGWLFRDRLPGPKRGASKHYGCQSLEGIIALHRRLIGQQFGARVSIPGTYPVASVSLLFLWRVASMQSEAIAVAESCGYKVKSELVWRKPHIGMGHYVRNRHEVCLICTRGTGVSDLILDHSIPSDFEAPTGEHSEKPEKFFEIVERLCKGPRLELFARKRRAGWTQFGDELK